MVKITKSLVQGICQFLENQEDETAQNLQNQMHFDLNATSNYLLEKAETDPEAANLHQQLEEVLDQD
jgi:hypothetical protein